MEKFILSPVALGELEIIIQESLRKVLLEKAINVQPDLPEQLTIEQAVLYSVENGTPLKKSHIYKETMLSGNGKSNFPVLKFGRRVVIPRLEFIEWLNSRTVKVPSLSDVMIGKLVKEANKKQKK